uniref:Ubiquitin-like domain-containing protein n=1 Tax=Hanusia phi TaxID=3032 RepID=A0A7S0E0Q8_9CRYP
MQITIRTSSGAQTVDCDASDSIELIKQRLQSEKGIACPEISYNGRILEDVCTLDDYDVSNSAILDVFAPLRGGKQHGSLARAGKVRGQTPKVEKQDKKKKKTGRAKRRIQYIRRFVNAVGGQFAKKSPNCLASQQMRAGVVRTE